MSLPRALCAALLFALVAACPRQTEVKPTPQEEPPPEPGCLGLAARELGPLVRMVWEALEGCREYHLSAEWEPRRDPVRAGRVVRA